MIRNSRWSSRGQRRQRDFGRPRSKKIHEYTREDAIKMRRKVFLILALLAVGYIFYLFFYSDYFKISQINFNGQIEGFKTEETTAKAYEIMSNNRSWPFSAQNYFTIKISQLEEELNQTNALASFKVAKKFPRSLEIVVEERLGRLLWVSSEQTFVLEADGLISGSIAPEEAAKASLPVIYDLSNTFVTTGETRVNDKQLALIMEVWLNLKNYDLPQIELDYFKVDSLQANYVKIVTKKGFELHVNYLASLDSQINKLKKSLASGKIDLNNINYINLRIENQVIYK
ncbi:MAG: FtsQ-type POTRA domain-containing protein [Candidatus Komeilibacteria bacterium]|nr:FtsQ-type POTRA domain-containing protein [Candidatus Komeilibacteria bacterium]